ncbi:tRNA (adenosine(37)-N6)-threonylcarbamoyltransferase complex dimerization subunit type 1 TsaB [Jonesiaceae bacterium BS-20]|uniref:tRNA (Adenosine(37)-N6)-threonylcarbamoyltransferase complex dimerization subunit type 1 TsaB n=1 Tax=Jonesiaceae bacterium BS-20 TaxID=3120821 RepID=A0AAU7DT19_9MICO
MTILAIDTSAAVSAALVQLDGTELASVVIHEQRRHAEQLAPLIADLLSQTGLSSTDITAVAVGTGPAPFTGLRVGLVSAQTFALGVGAQTFGVSSLDALGAQAAIELDLAPGTEILVTADARRKEIYFARYEVLDRVNFEVPTLRLITEPSVDKATQVVSDGHADGALVVGPGAVLYKEAFAGQTVAESDELVAVNPTVLARIALARRQAGKAQPTTPLYLRRPDAQVPAARKRALA